MQYYLSHIISLVTFSFALTLLVVGTTAAQCGKDAGGAQCPEGMCCSNYGYCGTSQDYCGPGHCQSQCPSPPSPPFTGRCGKDFGGAQCPQGMCCSNYGYCGTSLDYCGPGHCQSQCPSPPPPPPPFTPPPPPPPFTPPPPISPDDVSHIITEEIFEEFLLHRNDGDCEARGFYTYEAFLTAARRFPNFGTTGSLDIRKRELAAFFGQTSHETTGGWDGAPDGRYAWGYCYIREQNRGAYCHYSVEWPCVSGQLYYGRGPIQLTSNLNYGPAGEALGLDLLSNPDLVATDQVLTFEAAMWFWMTPRDNKPSCHDVITEQWIPTEADLKANRHPGYGVITNIINGGIECGNKDHVAQVEDRIGFYERYLEILGVEDTLGYLDCYDQLSFASGLMDPKYEKVLKMYVDLS